MLKTSRYECPRLVCGAPRHCGATAGPPAEIVAKVATSGARHLNVDEGITIQRFLSVVLIQRSIITRAPVLIGDGIPLFGTLPRDVRFRHVASRPYFTGENNEQSCLADNRML